MSTFIPPTPPKYGGERHVPLPRVDNYTWSPNQASNQLVWSPASSTRSLSPHRDQRTPVYSPLALPNLAALPSPAWSSAPLGATIHVLLHPVKTIIDVSLPQFTLRDITNSHHMNAPATNPPTLSMTLTSALLPYTISIKPSTAPYVTVNDVLLGIYTTLRQSITPEQQKLIPTHVRAAITQACQKRGGQSLRHVDMLLGASKVVGLRRVQQYSVDDEFWEIVVK